MNLSIVAPVFNDWVSCRMLLTHLDELVLPEVDVVRVILVDDGSNQPAPDDLCAALEQRRIDEVVVVELACNVGHQRAIALGLSVVADLDPATHVLIMDADGEDAPGDIPRLLAALAANPNGIVAAGRASRSEGLAFRVGYATYRALFRLLVGKQVQFGNFSLFGPAVLRRLLHMPETWNHIAATLLKSRFPLTVVPTSRAERYAGASSMNMPALVAHGLSAVAVFFDHVFARLLLLACAVAAVALPGAIIVAFMRLFTDMATPGWATTVIGVLLIVLLQTLLLVLVASLQMLGTRSQPGVQAKLLAQTLIERVRTLSRERTDQKLALKRRAGALHGLPAP